MSEFTEELNACKLDSERRWADMSVRVQKIEDIQKSHRQAIDKQADLIKDIQQLSTSVSILANNMEAMLKEQQRQNERIHTLENRPLKRWDSVVDKIIMLILGAIISLCLAKLGLQ